MTHEPALDGLPRHRSACRRAVPPAGEPGPFRRRVPGCRRVLRAVRLPDHRGVGLGPRAEGPCCDARLLDTPGAAAAARSRRVLRTHGALRIAVSLPGATTVGERWPGGEFLRLQLVLGVLDSGGSSLYTHLWSLSVEEQFYVLWPLLLAALLAAVRGDLRKLVAPIAVLIVASAAIMWWRFDHEGQAWAYVATDGRAQELLAGGLLAVVTFGRTARRYMALDAAGCLALGWLMWLFLTVDRHNAWIYKFGPLLITAAVLAVIGAATQPYGLLRGGLSFVPLQRLGLISYGVYLFHIPVLSAVYAQWPAWSNA